MLNKADKRELKHVIHAGTKVLIVNVIIAFAIVLILICY